jgi:Protein of unknown function (DUF3276).
MEEEAGITEVQNGSEDKNQKEEIFTKVVRAGKRTYFFDVKATRKMIIILLSPKVRNEWEKREKCFMKSIKYSSIKKISRNFQKG